VEDLGSWNGNGLTHYGHVTSVMVTYGYTKPQSVTSTLSHFFSNSRGSHFRPCANFLICSTYRCFYQIQFNFKYLVSWLKTCVIYYCISTDWPNTIKRHCAPEDGGSKDLWNFGILPQHYTASQPRRWRQHGPLKRTWDGCCYISTYGTLCFLCSLYYLLLVIQGAICSSRLRLLG
jgi:hypothetical protein